MTTLRHQVRILAPIDAVWSAISDLEAVRHYNPMVASVRRISTNAEGVGAARRCELTPKGRVEERVWKWGRRAQSVSRSPRATGRSSS